MIYLEVADESHAEAVAALIGALFEEVEHTPDMDAILEIYHEIESDDHHSTLIAFDGDGDAVGLITLAETLSFYAEGYIGMINELYVVPEYRSEGVGKMLLDAAKELAATRNWKRLEVTTPGDEYLKTRQFYEREGFFKIGPRYKYEI